MHRSGQRRARSLRECPTTPRRCDAISAVARELGRDRKQIHRWISRLAIDLPHE
jgi:transposase-like protein